MMVNGTGFECVDKSSVLRRRVDSEVFSSILEVPAASISSLQT